MPEVNEEDEDEEDDGESILSDHADQTSPQGDREKLVPNATLTRTLERPVRFRTTNWTARNLSFV